MIEFATFYEILEIEMMTGKEGSVRVGKVERNGRDFFLFLGS